MKYIHLAPLSISLCASFAIAGCAKIDPVVVSQQNVELLPRVLNPRVVNKSVRQHSGELMLSESVLMPSISRDISVYRAVSRSEKYKEITDNLPLDPAVQPLSTFSTDVDTASYSNVRRFINQGMLPPVDAVRTEEIVNYFDYHYSQPSSSQQPLKIAYELAPSPWNAKAQLLKVSLQAKDIKNSQGRNLVFLVDVSGSMSSADKLPLLKSSLHLLTKTLNAEDCIAIVAYAGNANIVLDATSGNAKHQINQAISSLRAGGSTNGGNGLDLAYQIAEANFIKGGVNRILLATDGDFNMGMSDVSQIKKYIEKKRETSVDLSVLGFGQGNYNDHLMEELSNAGNGNAAYIDSLLEAKKVLIHQANATFQNVAYDAKIQLEFNPAVVSSYRLLGYENRALADKDFSNDSKDAGDIGAGQSVTALYEIIYNGQAEQTKLRYKHQQPRLLDPQAEIGFIKIRYKLTHQAASREYSLAVVQSSEQSLAQSTASFRLAVAAAAYAQKLRNSDYLNNYTWQQIIDLAVSAKAEDAYGYRSSFIQQLRLSQALDQ